MRNENRRSERWGLERVPFFHTDIYRNNKIVIGVSRIRSMRGRMPDTVVYGKCCSPYTQIAVAAVVDIVDIGAVAVTVIRSSWV